MEIKLTAKRLYYDDAYTTRFNANIIETTSHDNHPAVILDQTYFYPSSGGQPYDTGKLAGVTVCDVIVRDSDQAVIHVLDQPISGSIVAAEVDWGRRFDHMQHHTGQHILTQAFVTVADANTVAFHLSADSVTIDLDKPIEALQDNIHNVETLANRIIQENHPVFTEVVDPETTPDFRMRKMPDHLLTGGLRIVNIGDFDRTACGGTHVRNTGEIGLLKILRLERRGEQTRVTFCCGNRALQDYDQKHQVITQLSTELTCHYLELPEAIQRMQDEFKALQRTIKSLTNQLLELEVPELLRNANQIDDLRVVMSVYDKRERSEIQSLASLLTAHPNTIALLASAGDNAHLVFASHADLSHDMNALLQQAFNRLGGGRGGGRPTLAQGGGVPATTQQLTTIFDQIATAFN